MKDEFGFPLSDLAKHLFITELDVWHGPPLTWKLYLIMKESPFTERVCASRSRRAAIKKRYQRLNVVRLFFVGSGAKI